MGPKGPWGPMGPMGPMGPWGPVYVAFTSRCWGKGTNEKHPYIYIYIYIYIYPEGPCGVKKRNWRKNTNFGPKYEVDSFFVVRLRFFKKNEVEGGVLSPPLKFLSTPPEFLSVPVFFSVDPLVISVALWGISVDLWGISVGPYPLGVCWGSSFVFVIQLRFYSTCALQYTIGFDIYFKPPHPHRGPQGIYIYIDIFDLLLRNALQQEE